MSTNNKELQDKYFKVSIKGDDWNIYLIAEDDNDTVEEGDIAVTKFSDREIYFKGTSILDIKHEVFHVYFGYCYVETANLTQGQVEEISCELYSHEEEKMKRTSLEIKAGLDKLVNEKE
jgi:hypothetical protein